MITPIAIHFQEPFYTQILDTYRKVTPHELSMVFPALPEGYVQYEIYFYPQIVVIGEFENMYKKYSEQDIWTINFDFLDYFLNGFIWCVDTLLFFTGVEGIIWTRL